MPHSSARPWLVYPVLYAHAPEAAMKLIAAYGLFAKTVVDLGSDGHKQLVDDLENGTDWISYALTEVGHGSNANGISTTATFDPKTQEFIINTPNFEAAKCWIANLGKTSTISLIYARLISDNIDNGLTAFVIPIRDPKTLTPYPGVKVGDLGEKIGLNGMDNGFVIFKNYRVSRDCLLNKFIDLTPEGEVFYPKLPSVVENPLAVLPAGRLTTMSSALEYFAKAIPIAVRYSAVRKQSGPSTDEPEWSIIEYPAQQMRVFPHLANAYVVWNCITYLADIGTQFYSEEFEKTAESFQELHAICSAGKSIVTWLCRDAIQDCREACGGHGYMRGK